jgi:hypothetical protein
MASWSTASRFLGDHSGIDVDSQSPLSHALDGLEELSTPAAELEDEFAVLDELKVVGPDLQ